MNILVCAAYKVGISDTGNRSGVVLILWVDISTLVRPGWFLSAIVMSPDTNHQ